MSIGRLRPFKIVISNVFKVRYAPGSGPSRDRLVNYRFVPIAVTLGSSNNCNASHPKRIL